MKHKHIVMDLVVTARARKMTPLLGVLYDELVRCVDVSVHSACVLLCIVFWCACRKHWAEMSAKMTSKVEMAAESLNED